VASTFRRVALQWGQVVIQAVDVVALGRWWADALGWVVVDDAPDEFEIRPTPDRLPGIIFEAVSEPKAVPNRLYPDFRPDDQDAEPPAWTSARVPTCHGWCSPIPRATSSACSARAATNGRVSRHALARQPVWATTAPPRATARRGCSPRRTDGRTTPVELADCIPSLVSPQRRPVVSWLRRPWLSRQAAAPAPRCGRRTR
jgi:Glyoxalase-like domain